MPRAKSHKQVTHLHHAHTYSTFTHHLSPSPAPPSPSTQTFHAACSVHTLLHTPVHILQVVQWEVSPACCSLNWVPRRQDQ